MNEPHGVADAVPLDQLPASVVADAEAAGFDPATLLRPAAAARLAGYDGARATSALAAARRRGQVRAVAWRTNADGSPRDWLYPASEVDRLRRSRGAPRPEAAIRPEPLAEGPAFEAVPRVEHELELEVERLRGRVAALEAGEERLREQLAQARAEADRFRSALAALAVPHDTAPPA